MTRQDSLYEILSPESLESASLPLERASTLPAAAFTSERVYELEQARIFSREWLCAGRVDQVPEPGDFFCLDLLDDKLVVVRGQDGRVRVLSRACRHRAAEVVTGSGNARSFQCPYHAWTYRLDGSLAGAPFMENVEGFDRKACRLPEIRSEVWEGFLFVNFDASAAPLAPRLEPLRERLAGFRMADMVAVETATYESPFNWKVLVDNFMEAYHHIATHRDTLEPLFPAKLAETPDAEGPFSVLVMPAKGSGPGEGGAPTESLPIDAGEALVAAVVFPFHLFAPAHGSLVWYQLLPVRSDHFVLRIYGCFPKGTFDDPAAADAAREAQALVRVVHGQDIEACEATWSGLQARSFESGRLNGLEKSIWQFNQWWRACMEGEEDAA